jgi:uncharacterized protein (DUF1778 family)
LERASNRLVASAADELARKAPTELRLRPENKGTLTRAEAGISELHLSERDPLRILALLENPPAAPEHLKR